MKQLLRICVILLAVFNTFSFAMETDEHNQELENLIPCKELLESADQTIKKLKECQKKRTWGEAEEVYNQFQQTLPPGQELAKLVVGMRALKTENFLQFVAEDALKKEWFPKTKRLLNEDFYQLGTEVLNEEGVVVPYRLSYKQLEKMNQNGVCIQDFSSNNHFRKYTWGLGCLSCEALRLNTPQNDYESFPIFHINHPLTITPDFAYNTNLTILLLKNIKFTDDQDISELSKLTQLKYLYLLHVHFNLENAEDEFNSLLKQLEQLETLKIKGFLNNSAFIPEDLPPKLSSFTFKSGPLIKFPKASSDQLLEKLESISEYDVHLFSVDDNEVSEVQLSRK